MTRAVLWPLLALAALSCTDGGAVGRLRPKLPAAAGGGAGAAGAPAVCSQPPCATLPCSPATDWWCPLCAGDQDCADDETEKLCNPHTAFCVECRADDDCPASRPLCDDGDCGECAEDSDCPDDGKCENGRCEPD